MRVAQMLQMQGRHGGVLNSPSLTGSDALKILAYWWRTRGRFWKGWHQALAKLQSTGLKPTKEALDQVFTEEQSKIVWLATDKAVQDMDRLASHLPPADFRDDQTEKVAKVMLRRFFVKDLGSKIPPPIKRETPKRPDLTQARKPEKRYPKIPKKLPVPIPDLPEPGKLIPKHPRLPSGKKAFGWLLLFALLVAGKEN